VPKNPLPFWAEDFLIFARRAHLRKRSAADWVRIFTAERVKLACKRQGERYSLKANFPLRVPKNPLSHESGFSVEIYFYAK